MIYQEPPQDNQEAFDRVWNTFIVQRQPRAVKTLSPHSGIESCLYRTEEGTGCAIGCQIPDALYDPRLEGKNALTLVEFEHKIGDHFVKVTPKLLDALQRAHDDQDSVNIDYFRGRLAAVADSFGLLRKAQHEEKRL